MLTHVGSVFFGNKIQLATERNRVYIRGCTMTNNGTLGEYEKENREMRQATTAFMRSIKEIMDINPSMPVSQVYVLTTVALNEGKSLIELSRQTGIRHATMSRYLLDLSDKLRTGDEGYKLVNRDIDPEELRRNMYTLAPKGRFLFRKITDFYLASRNNERTKHDG
jgi:DNA-binding MarR family transcriptional regulator